MKQEINSVQKEHELGKQCYDAAYKALCKIVADTVDLAVTNIKIDAPMQAKCGQFSFYLDNDSEKYNKLYMQFGRETPPGVSVESMIMEQLTSEVRKLGMYLYKDYTDAYSDYKYCVSFYERVR